MKLVAANLILIGLCVFAIFSKADDNEITILQINEEIFLTHKIIKI